MYLNFNPNCVQKYVIGNSKQFISGIGMTITLQQAEDETIAQFKLFHRIRAREWPLQSTASLLLELSRSLQQIALSVSLCEYCLRMLRETILFCSDHATQIFRFGCMVYDQRMGFSIALDSSSIYSRFESTALLTPSVFTIGYRHVDIHLTLDLPRGMRPLLWDLSANLL